MIISRVLEMVRKSLEVISRVLEMVRKLLEIISRVLEESILNKTHTATERPTVGSPVYRVAGRRSLSDREAESIHLAEFVLTYAAERA